VRIIWIVMLSIGIWLGFKADRFLYMDRCLDAGGQLDPRGFCALGKADE
jgi:hypothetical protein